MTWIEIGKGTDDECILKAEEAAMVCKNDDGLPESGSGETEAISTRRNLTRPYAA